MFGDFQQFPRLKICKDFAPFAAAAGGRLYLRVCF